MAALAGGTNFHGQTFSQSQKVNASTVGALSFGVPIPQIDPSDACHPCALNITVTLHFASGTPGGAGHTSVPLELDLTVEREPLPANGTEDSWRVARMAWLDSTKGMNLETSAQFQPLVIDARARTIRLSGDRAVTLGPDGLPASMTGRGHEILAGPAAFKLAGATTDVRQAVPAVELSQPGPGLAVWSATSVLRSATALTPHVPAATWRISVLGSCTYDGFIDLNISVACTGASDCSSDSAELSIPLRKEVARWMMGLEAASGSWPPRLLEGPTVGRQGTTERTRSVGFAWQEYSRAKPRMQAWLGTPSAGVRIKLKGSEDAWNSPIELPDDTATLTNLSWGSCTTSTKCSESYNKVCCLGVMNVTQQTPSSDVVFTATTGPINITAGHSMDFMLDLLITPNKPVNTTQHFTTRYYHCKCSRSLLRLLL